MTFLSIILLISVIGTVKSESYKNKLGNEVTQFHNRKLQYDFFQKLVLQLGDV